MHLMRAYVNLLSGTDCFGISSLFELRWQMKKWRDFDGVVLFVQEK